eukprot:scaffold612741_cov18-Prasinocladus_malaysianus.AAC.1
MAAALWPLYERVRLMPHELAWTGPGADEDTARQVWWARWILKMIGRHDTAWVPIERLRRDSL